MNDSIHASTIGLRLISAALFSRHGSGGIFETQSPLGLDNLTAVVIQSVQYLVQSEQEEIIQIICFVVI